MADRRDFLKGMSFTLGGTTLATWLPASLLQAAPAACLVDATAWPDACGDWQLDDICIAYPPYSLHMKPAMPQNSVMNAQVEPVDSHWVA
ncbi:MAG: hypothetical protein ABI645_04215 [Pseudomonadota bacterium]